MLSDTISALSRPVALSSVRPWAVAWTLLGRVRRELAECSRDRTVGSDKRLLATAAVRRHYQHYG